LFTSAGADADLSRWLAPDRSFDVWVTYRGQGEPSWWREVDRFERSSAAKFPAFKLAHAGSMNLLCRYDAVFLLDDDIVIMEDRQTARSGDIVAALIDGETTLKRYVTERGKPYLKAENPKFPDLIPARELRIQGVMTSLVRKQSPG
jgi:hypothetical protein